MNDKDAPLGPTLVLGGLDRRTADRVIYAVEAQLVHGENLVLATTEDVSAGGTFLRVPSLLPVGSRVSIRFQLPAGPFESGATVMRIRPGTADRPPGIGVMFHDVPAEHRARLEQLCPPAKAIVREGPG